MGPACHGLQPPTVSTPVEVAPWWSMGPCHRPPQFSNCFILVLKTAKAVYLTATVRTVPTALRRSFDGFEGWLLGAGIRGSSLVQRFAASPLDELANYAQNAGVGSLYLDTSIQLKQHEGSESVFLIHTNPVGRTFLPDLALSVISVEFRRFGVSHNLEAVFFQDVRGAHRPSDGWTTNSKSPNEPGEPVDGDAIQYVQDYNTRTVPWQHIEGTPNGL